MKKFWMILTFLSLVSCEEVVDVELEKSEPRLVIEASLLYNEELENNLQIIRLTLTAPYFEEQVPPATNAMVKVTLKTGEEYFFTETGEGIYQNDQLNFEENVEYTLEVIYEGEVYTATEEFVSAPEIQFVEQDLGGFSGEDYEFKIFYTDPAEIDNFYLFRYLNEKYSLQIYDDQFTDGNQTFAFFNDEDANPGDLVMFELQGISRGFYEYLFILRSQAGTNNGGPFQTQPSIVRGNIVNQTNPENFPFGFFRLSEVNTFLYEVE